MKRPKSWNKLIPQGIIPTDAVDGCLLAGVMMRQAQYLRIANAKQKLEDNETPARKRNLENEYRRLAHIQAKTDLLLNAIKPKAIISWRSPKGKNIFYVIHAIGDHRYMRVVSQATANDIAAKENLSITNVAKLSMPTYELSNVPSYATVNEIVATLASGKISTVIENGAFDKERYLTENEMPVVDKDISDKLYELGHYYTVAFQDEIVSD